jgi:hypothetical protein
MHRQNPKLLFLPYRRHEPETFHRHQQRLFAFALPSIDALET